VAGASSTAQREPRTVLFVDESAFSLLPGVVRTYAPKGQTPTLRVPLTRDHLSVISAITPDGQLFLYVQEDPIRSDAVVQFLRPLLHQVPGRLLVIWDGAPIHRSQTVQAFLAGGAARRLHLARLPAYAPELNPDEGIWRYLKYAELRNLGCPPGGTSTTRSASPPVASAASPTSSAPASSTPAACNSPGSAQELPTLRSRRRWIGLGVHQPT
jgi:transposase